MLKYLCRRDRGDRVQRSAEPLQPLVGGQQIQVLAGDGALADGDGLGELPYSLSGGPVRLAAERGEKRGEARVAGQGAGRSAAQRGQRQRRGAPSST